MKHLFIIRHGVYESSDLTGYGQLQIARIAEEMKAIIGAAYNGHYLLSSTAPRAEQSGEIIAKAFGIGIFDRDQRLWTGGGENLSENQLKAIDTMIAPHKDKNDIVTITAHYEVVGSYPGHIVKTLFGRDEYIQRPKPGEGIHLDLEGKTYQMLPRR